MDSDTRSAPRSKPHRARAENHIPRRRDETQKGSASFRTTRRGDRRKISRSFANVQLSLVRRNRSLFKSDRMRARARVRERIGRRRWRRGRSKQAARSRPLKDSLPPHTHHLCLSNATTHTRLSSLIVLARATLAQAVFGYVNDPQPGVVRELYPWTAMCVRNVDVHVSCSSHVDAQLAAFFIDPRAK